MRCSWPWPRRLRSPTTTTARSKAKLDSYQEAPLTLSTAGTGTFRIKLRSDGLHYTLRYRGLATPAFAAHIHLGARGLAGGVIAFLCGGSGEAGLSA